ncbi:MAG: flagellar basal-body MS-ring/collar protein FliF [Myxococcota bacterium]|nr:flagellar basal-body MS-ring/collar protein FliF [Myxococcota bacterium]
MDQVKERLKALEEKWKALNARVRIGILAGAGVLVAGAILFFAHGSSPDYGILFSNLSQEDAARIVERLRAMNVDYELAEGGGTILVPDASVHETRLTLANEGLPSGGGVGFELFDTQRFGESDFSEQVQFRRALEGELARTIRHLAGVESARVHLVLPERRLFTTDESEASASVALHMNPGWRLREDQVQGVQHLVASSVQGLSPSNVTVVDGDGRPLSEQGGGAGEGVSDAEDLRRQIEQGKQRAVQQLLDASLGPGVAVVRVSAEVDMSRVEDLQETYDPDRIATRSFEVTEERTADAEGDAQGIPGAASNLPGGPAAEATAGESAAGRRHERRNYEVTKTVRRQVRPVGRLSRLTVAVVVDGTWTGEGDGRSYTERDADELARIRSLVATAAGISAERGDEVTVENVPFAGSQDVPAAHPSDFIAVYEPWLPYAAGAALFLLALIGGVILWLRRKRKKKEREQEEKLRELEARAAGQEVDSDDPDALPAPTPVAELGAGEEDDFEGYEGDVEAVLADYEQLRVLALEVARRDPELAARVVRGWLADDVKAQKKDDASKEAA